MSNFVGGRYQLIAHLGGGGMANVFLAKLTGKADFEKLAVVKRLKPIEDENLEYLSMFAEEARLSARLNHPHIVQTFEVGEDTDGPFLVMEYIEGQSVGRIRSRAARRGVTIPRSIIFRMMRDTLSALAYAHALCDHDGSPLDLVHRDVSPENIMITYAGITKLVDFGVAKALGSMNETRAGVIKGKVSYMAPEQARSGADLDGRADVFSAGLLLWELLASRRMWAGLTELDVLQNLVDDSPLPRLQSVDPDLPEELDALCAKALEKDPNARFASANDFLDALEAACDRAEYRISSREVGEFVAGLFATEREKVRTLVSSSVRRYSGGLSSGSPVPRLEDGFGGTPSQAPSSVGSASSSWSMMRPPSVSFAPGSISDASYSPRLDTGMTTGSVGSLPPPEPRHRRLNPFVVAIVAAPLLAAVAAGLVIRLVAPTREPAPPPSAAATVAPPAVRETTINVTAHPSTARISIDGRALGGSTFLRRGPAEETTHELRVEADGHEPRTIMLGFDRDQTLDVALARTSAPPPAPRPPAPVAVPPRFAPPPVVRAPAAPAPKPPAPAPEPTTSPEPAPSAREIGEIDPQKRKSNRPDKIDTDIMKR